MKLMLNAALMLGWPIASRATRMFTFTSDLVEAEPSPKLLFDQSPTHPEEAVGTIQDGRGRRLSSALSPAPHAPAETKRKPATPSNFSIAELRDERDGIAGCTQYTCPCQRVALWIHSLRVRHHRVGGQPR